MNETDLSQGTPYETGHGFLKSHSGMINHNSYIVIGKNE